MPFPAGMVTRVISIPAFFDLEGQPVRGEVRITAARALVWDATGETILRDASSVTNGSAVLVTLPTTDQSGVSDGAGNSVTDWTYTISYSLSKGVTVPDATFTLPLDDGSTLVIPPDVSGLVSGGVVTIGGSGSGGPAVWGGITGTLSDQTDLQTALNGKQVAGSYAAAVHTHAQADVTNLVADLAGKAATSHTHAAADVTSGTLAAARLPAATGAAQGAIILTGDLGGTASSPTVPGLAAKAPLASPALTGTPTVPTAAGGTNTTQAASTAFVQDAIFTRSVLIADIGAKGQLFVGLANDAYDVLPVGTNGQVLTADSAQTLGVKWATPSGGSSILTPGSPGPALVGLPGRQIQQRVDTAHTSNRVTLAFFWTPVPITIDSLQTDFFSITGTGGKMRVAVYAATDQSTPGNLVSALGNITMTAASVDQAITPVVVPAGRYFLAQHSDFEGTVTAVTTRVLRYAFLAGQDGTHSIGSVFTATLASGAAWPTSLGTITENTADLNANGEPSGYVTFGWSE